MLWLLACVQTSDTSATPREWVVVTLNGGTTTGLAHDEGDDAYTSEHAAIADALYENSLSWNPAEDALRGWLAETDPDIVVFQEIFWDPWCEEIEVDPALDFVCGDYSADRPLQIERLLGPDYQVSCAPGQPDNCAGVHTRIGLAGELDGSEPDSGCSSGARVSWLEVEGLRVTNAHGSSGLSTEDKECRRDQFAQIAWHAPEHLVMGDFNTDPTRLADADVSAAYLAEQLAAPAWTMHTDGTPSYAGILAIDHVFSNVFQGGCEIGRVWDTVYWDHLPVVCRLTR